MKIDGISEKYATFFGTVIHERNNLNIAIELVRNGLAQPADWSMSYTSASAAASIHAAVHVAKNARLRLWKSYTPPVIPGEKTYSGTVAEIVSGDTIIVRVGTPENLVLRPWYENCQQFSHYGRCCELIIYFCYTSGIVKKGGFSCLQSARQGSTGQELMSHLRKMRRISCVPGWLESKSMLMWNTWLSCKTSSENLGLWQWQRRKERVTLRFCCWKQVLRRWLDISREQNAHNFTMVRLFCLGKHISFNIEFFRVDWSWEESSRCKEGIVGCAYEGKAGRRRRQAPSWLEYVFNGARLKVLVPAQGLLITFNLSGVQCARTGAAAAKDKSSQSKFSFWNNNRVSQFLQLS